jgi:hypothetical protein
MVAFHGVNSKSKSCERERALKKREGERRMTVNDHDLGMENSIRLIPLENPSGTPKSIIIF